MMQKWTMGTIKVRFFMNANSDLECHVLDGCGEVAVIVEHNQRRLMETIEDEAEKLVL
jgi:hypothetical protein